MGTGTGTGTYWLDDPPEEPEEEDCSDDDDDEELDSAEVLDTVSKTKDNMRFNVKAMTCAVLRGNQEERCV